MRHLPPGPVTLITFTIAGFGALVECLPVVVLKILLLQPRDCVDVFTSYASDDGMITFDVELLTDVGLPSCGIIRCWRAAMLWPCDDVH